MPPDRNRRLHHSVRQAGIKRKEFFFLPDDGSPYRLMMVLQDSGPELVILVPAADFPRVAFPDGCNPYFPPGERRKMHRANFPAPGNGVPEGRSICSERQAIVSTERPDRRAKNRDELLRVRRTCSAVPTAYSARSSRWKSTAENVSPEASRRLLLPDTGSRFLRRSSRALPPPDRHRTDGD